MNDWHSEVHWEQEDHAIHWNPEMVVGGRSNESTLGNPKEWAKLGSAMPREFRKETRRLYSEQMCVRICRMGAAPFTI